jgi:L-alanine-DL-glutamate epimerase-like enolase superfamily enzyme
VIPERLELVPYSLRFAEPYVTARGQLDEKQLLLIRIHDADGAVGLGEASPLALRGGPGIDQLVGELRDLCWPLLEGRSIGPSPGQIARALAACRGRGASLQAIAAVDIALHDLAAKLGGVPLWRLLGAPESQPVRCNATLPAANPSRMNQLADEWAARGFTTFKLKVGVPGDVQQVARVREALGPEALIRVDANATWRAAEAVEKLRAMVQSRLEIVEQPAPDLEDLAEVRRRTGLRIAADESVVEAGDARRAAKIGACEIATVKLAKVGGIVAAREVAEELPVYLSSALDGPVGIAAAVHAAQAIDDAGAAHGLATAELFTDTIAARECLLDRDELSAPEGPGLGVEIDEELLASRAA